MLPREITQQNEQLCLSPQACRAYDSKGRLKNEPLCDIRTDFQRDRDRIIHSSAFRRLKHKTQVFLIPKSDYYRTRLTHTLEVSQIARTVARALRLNEDLTEAIALGHDLGHTPFGHDGEKTLNRLYYGGFRHYEQSLRVVDVIEKEGQGLNLTAEVRNGILSHTNKYADTLEGVVVRFSDKIAYINADIDDAVKSGVLKQEDLPEACVKVLGGTKSERITTLVKSIIENSNDTIKYGDEVGAAHDRLRTFMFDNVYYSPKVNSEKEKARYILEYLYNHYIVKPEKMPRQYRRLADDYGTERAVCDFISGMTDDYAVEIFKDMCLPRQFKM